MEEAGLQPGLFNKDISVGNKKLWSRSWDITSVEQAVQPLFSENNPVECDRK